MVGNADSGPELGLMRLVAGANHGNAPLLLPDPELNCSLATSFI